MHYEQRQRGFDTHTNTNGQHLIMYPQQSRENP